MHPCSPRRWTLALALAISTFGCESSVTLVLDLKTDYRAGIELDEVRVTVGDAAPVAASFVGGEEFLPAHRIHEAPGLAAGTHAVRVELLLEGAVVAQRDVTVEVREATAVTILLSRLCAGVECPATGDGADAISCLAGRCVQATCLDGDQASCGEGCASADECPSGAECAVATCENGACVLAADDAMCAPEQRCHPEDGCTPPRAAFLSFDGDDDFLSATASTDFDTGTEPFALEMRLRVPAAPAMTHPWLMSVYDGDTGFALGLTFPDVEFAISRRVAAGDCQNSSPGGRQIPLPSDTFAHLVAQRTDSLTVYVDGVEGYSTRAVETDQTNGRLRLGAAEAFCATFGRSLEGDIEYTRFWRRALTLDEIVSLAGGTPPQDRTGLVGEWLMNEGDGQTVADSAGTNPLTLGDSPAEEATDPTWGTP